MGSTWRTRFLTPNRRLGREGALQKKATNRKQPDPKRGPANGPKFGPARETQKDAGRRTPCENLPCSNKLRLPSRAAVQEKYVLGRAKHQVVLPNDFENAEATSAACGRFHRPVCATSPVFELEHGRIFALDIVHTLAPEKVQPLGWHSGLQSSCVNSILEHTYAQKASR